MDGQIEGYILYNQQIIDVLGIHEKNTTIDAVFHRKKEHDLDPYRNHVLGFLGTLPSGTDDLRIAAIFIFYAFKISLFSTLLSTLYLWDME